MLLLALSAALALQIPAATADLPADTLAAYDTPATRALVEHAIEASGEVPEELRDYRAEVRSSLFLTLATDSTRGGDLPATVDELASVVRWKQGGWLHQVVRAHRTRLLVPAPYTLATILEQPWVVPHLYGGSIRLQSAYTPFAGRRAIHPFGPRGPEHYRYTADDPVRIRVQGEVVTLVPITVHPRVPADDQELVIGTFWLDVDRGAVARARFGFTGGEGFSFGDVETYLDLENALWEGRFWLPFRQRREVVFSSVVLGGRVAARVVNHFADVALNTGWTPEGERIVLRYDLAEDAVEWEGPVGEDAGEYAIEDFHDLRIATAADPAETDDLELGLHYERAEHLFRYNRVEGAFLGLGARLLPSDPLRERWSVYGTAGWAFAEETVRGELSALWRAPSPPSLAPDADWGVEATVYRRLRDIQAFRPTFEWDLLYSIPALLWGSDLRDYYDATGAELFALAEQDPWFGRLGGRVEEHSAVEVNTEGFLFGEAEEFGPLAGIEPGTHAAVEATAGYSRGPGAFGIGNSTVARVQGEVGVGDFRMSRVTGLLSARSSFGPVTLATRVDGGHAWGEVPPQFLFRFGGTEGLRGFDANEFGGSSALIARGRLLIGLPPRAPEPLARVGFFLIPPLRPSLVLLGETGWSDIDDELTDELLRLGARPTEGFRSSVGAGLSFFDDAITIEYVHPVGEAEERDGTWYVGLVGWY